jgi:cell division protein FtsB
MVVDDEKETIQQEKAKVENFDAQNASMVEEIHHLVSKQEEDPEVEQYITGEKEVSKKESTS